MASAKELGHTDIQAKVIELLSAKNTMENLLYIEKKRFYEKTGLPKGIDPLTLEKIGSVFSDPCTSLSAEQVGEQIGSSRTTARRYLEYLVGEQELSADINYGTVGRPERFYRKRA